MSEFFFVLKIALFSALVLLVLQFRVGGVTLEEHTERRIYRSRIGSEMRAVAHGAVNAGHDGWAWVKDQYDDKIGSQNSHSSSREMHRERSLRNRSQSDDLD